MTNRLSSSGRSHTEDSIFLKPEEDPVWLDEPTGADRLRDLRATAAKRSVSLGPQAGGPPGGRQAAAAAERGPQGKAVQKTYGLVLELQRWAAVLVLSQVTVSAVRHGGGEGGHAVTFMWRNSHNACWVSRGSLRLKRAK